MGVPNSEVGYNPAMPRREHNEVHKGHVAALGKKKSVAYVLSIIFTMVRWNDMQRMKFLGLTE